MIAVGCKSEGGKSELRRAVRRVTPGQGNLKESGTENIPPAFACFARFGVVRVKRCGKSAARRRSMSFGEVDGRPVRGFRVGRLIPPAMAGLEEWSSLMTRCAL